MRNWGIVALCAALGGCAASREEVVNRLGGQYIGQNVDVLVMRFGPPASTFKMNSGDTSYIWQLGNQTNINSTPKIPMLAADFQVHSACMAASAETNSG
jgi:hypothetical protein